MEDGEESICTTLASEPLNAAEHNSRSKSVQADKRNKTTILLLLLCFFAHLTKHPLSFISSACPLARPPAHRRRRCRPSAYGHRAIAQQRYLPNPHSICSHPHSRVIPLPIAFVLQRSPVGQRRRRLLLPGAAAQCQPSLLLHISLYWVERNGATSAASSRQRMFSIIKETESVFHYKGDRISITRYNFLQLDLPRPRVSGTHTGRWWCCICFRIGSLSQRVQFARLFVLGDTCTLAMDLLDDIFSEPSTVKAPVRAKFQPKAKPRPQKGPSYAGSTHAALAIKEQAIPSTLAQSDSNGNLTAEVKDVGSLVTGHSEIAMSKASADGCLSLGTTLGSQGAEGVIGQSPKEDMHMLDASATQAAEDTSGFPNLVCASSLPFRPCNGDGLPILSTSQESRHSKETVVGCAGGFQIDMQQKQETVDFSFLEVVGITGDAVAPSGTRAVKFQPMPKGQSTRKTNTTMVVSHLPDAANVPSENQHINGDGLIHAVEPLTVSDLSHVRLDGDFGTEATVVQLDTVVLDDVDSVVTLNFSKESGNTEKRKTLDAEAFSHSLDEGGISLGVEATEDGYGYLDGVIDEIQFNSSSPAEAINEVAANSDEYNDDCHSKGETSENRLHNSEKVSSGNGKPSRKRRNEAKPPEESTKKARKKFPHATRRKRSVDKSLLEAPDEIELRKVPIRDLIILSEYKECQANKPAAVVQRPTTSERWENTLPEDPTYNEDDEAYGSDQGTDSFNNPSTSGIIEDTGYFNYQSYMDRKHIRWSKHETELFYQGLQEFGSDFTMIQQSYFPDRSRHHIKLKYKKEEREHPMRIHDALTTRAKGLSHFEVLIQKLQEQEQAGQEKAEQSGDDNLIGSTFKEDEGGDEETHATSKEAPEPKQNGGSAALNQRPDNTARVESPAKSYDSEEEFNWNEYKSEL